MIFSQNRPELRKMYSDAWKKYCNKLPLTSLEAQIVDVVMWHPEYHKNIDIKNIDRDYFPDEGHSNPFLHMGLHLGLREQIATNRPTGIKKIYLSLISKVQDEHKVEHQMIECLAEILWEAQSQKKDPNEIQYLKRLKELVNEN